LPRSQGDFTQGASVAQLERVTRGYLEHGSVVPLGRVDGEHRFTTRDLLACERSIVEGATRRAGERTGVLHPRLPDLVLADLRDPLNEQQADAARALAADGQGVSVLQALAGTGKTRVLGAVARIYESAGYQVVGVARTGRAARELADTGIAAFTIHRLLAELEESDGFAPRTVVLFDEAGTAPTRPSAELFALAERSGAKMIAAGDSGQLPSVAAGGWFAATAADLAGPELREVVRQRDPTEREALEALHDGDPDPYIELKRKQGALSVQERADGPRGDPNVADRDYVRSPSSPKPALSRPQRPGMTSGRLPMQADTRSADSARTECRAAMWNVDYDPTGNASASPACPTGFGAEPFSRSFPADRRS
jgi:hypothetical protein